VECFGGLEKGEPGEARGGGGQQGRGPARVAGASTGDKGQQGGSARAGGVQARGGQHGPRGGARAGRSSTGALCTEFTLIV